MKEMTRGDIEDALLECAMVLRCGALLHMKDRSQDTITLVAGTINVFGGDSVRGQTDEGDDAEVPLEDIISVKKVAPPA